MMAKSARVLLARGRLGVPCLTVEDAGTRPTRAVGDRDGYRE
jgi:hypothetical protein